MEDQRPSHVKECATAFLKKMGVASGIYDVEFIMGKCGICKLDAFADEDDAPRKTYYCNETFPGSGVLEQIKPFTFRFDFVLKYIFAITINY